MKTAHGRCEVNVADARAEMSAVGKEKIGVQFDKQDQLMILPWDEIGG